MSFLKKLGVFIISSILILFLIILSFSFTLNSLLYPQTYFQAFDRSGIYDYIEDNLNISQGAIFISMPNGPKPLIETLFSNILSYLRSDTDTLNLTVKIDQEKLRNFFLDSLNSTKECLPNQDPFNKTNPCLPKGMNHSEFLDNFLERKNISFFEKDTIDLTQVYGLEEGSKGKESLMQIREYIEKYKLAQWILWVLVIIFISFIYLLQQNKKKFFKTLGLILLISSLGILTISYIINNLSFNLPNPLLVKLTQQTTKILINKLILFSSIMGIIAIISFIILFVIKNPKIESNLNLKSKAKK